MSKREMEHLDANDRAAYLDRALDPSARAAATEHLAECAACRELLAGQVRAAEGLGGTAASAGRTGGWNRSRAGWLLAAAVAAAFLGLAILARQGRDRPAVTAVQGPEPRPETVPTLPPARPGPGATDRPPATPPPAPPAEPRVPAAAVDPELLALRGATKRVRDKTFRLKEGAWVDTLYEPEAPVPPRPLARGSVAYGDALAAHPALARYADVGPVVIVVLDSLAYRIFTTP